MTSFAALRLTSKNPICSLAEVMLKHIIGVVLSRSNNNAVTAVRFQINGEASRPFVSLQKCEITKDLHQIVHKVQN